MSWVELNSLHQTCWQSQQTGWWYTTYTAVTSTPVLEEWVLSTCLNKKNNSSGSRRCKGSRFQDLKPYTAKLHWPVDVLVQGTRRATETKQYCMTDDDQLQMKPVHTGWLNNTMLYHADTSTSAPLSWRSLADKLETMVSRRPLQCGHDDKCRTPDKWHCIMYQLEATPYLLVYRRLWTVVE